jgi:hypothetical protein
MKVQSLIFCAWIDRSGPANASEWTGAPLAAHVPATDEVGRVQSREPRYNNMRKNFSAIVGHSVAVV